MKLDIGGDEMAEETWKPIVGYEGMYEVSDLGRVKSLDRVILKGGLHVHLPERILSGHINRDGYVRYQNCRR